MTDNHVENDYLISELFSMANIKINSSSKLYLYCKNIWWSEYSQEVWFYKMRFAFLVQELMESSR